MPSLAELRRQKLKEQEEIKKEPEVKITPGEKEITLVDLKPPKPIRKPPESKETKEPIFFIDWDYLAKNSSFQRGFTEFIKHTFPQYKTVDHRASKDVMNQQLKEKTNEITTALNIVNKIDSKLLRELRENPLYVEQKLKHNK
jgi:hypothetical protein